MNQGKWEFCKLSDPAMISLLCNIACVEIYTTIRVPRWLISIQASCHRSVRPVDISREIFCLFGVAHHCANFYEHYLHYNVTVFAGDTTDLLEILYSSVTRGSRIEVRQRLSQSI